MCVSVCERMCVCARARVCVFGRTRVRIAFVHSAPPSTVAFVGSQAFEEASAFNAAIGAWNTASVNSIRDVCAAWAGARTALGRQSDI